MTLTADAVVDALAIRRMCEQHPALLAQARQEIVAALSAAAAAQRPKLGTGLTVNELSIELLERVSAACAVPSASILSESRTARTVTARHLFWWLLKHGVGLSWVATARQFERLSGRLVDHTSVRAAVLKIDAGRHDRRRRKLVDACADLISLSA